MKVAHRVIEVMLMGCNSVFRGVDASWMLTIITTNQIHLKEVGSSNGDASVCQS